MIDIPNKKVIAKGSRSNDMYQLKSKEFNVLFQSASLSL